MSEPFIIAVILNTNRRQDTLEALASLEQSTYRNRKTIVLDNASQDGSIEAIRTAFPAVEILKLTENLGYAGNNNVGIQAALAGGADWVLVLNEDILLAPDCLEHLVRVGESDRNIGIVGPMVYHYDEKNVIQSAGGKLDRHWQPWHVAQNEPDHGRFVQPRCVDWISGCAIMIRRQAIEQAGMLDARFFYYWEETEWCVRTSKGGWSIVHVPQAKIWHKGVQRNYQPGASVTYYSTRNWLLLLAKHNAPLWARVLAYWQVLRTLTSWTLRPKWRSKRQHRDAMWRGLVDFVRRRWGRMPS